MKTITLSLALSLALVFLIALSFGCDSDNNVSAQDGDAPGAMTPGMTTVKGSVIAIDGECSSQLDGFDTSDEVTVTLVEGNGVDLPTAKVENTTKGTSVDCSMASGSGVLVDELPYSGMVCEPANSTIPGLSNAEFMSMVVSFTWLDNFVDEIPKTVIVASGDISGMSDTKSFPCARVKIESLMASN